MEEVHLSRKKRRIPLTSTGTGDNVKEIESAATDACSNLPFSTDDVTSTVSTSSGPKV